MLFAVVDGDGDGGDMYETTLLNTTAAVSDGIGTHTHSRSNRSTVWWSDGADALTEHSAYPRPLLCPSFPPPHLFPPPNFPPITTSFSCAAHRSSNTQVIVVKPLSIVATSRLHRTPHSQALRNLPC